MPEWFDKLKTKAEETVHDQEKMDRIKGKVQDTLHDPEKMAQVKGKAQGLVDKVTHHSDSGAAARSQQQYSDMTTNEFGEDAQATSELEPSGDRAYAYDSTPSEDVTDFESEDRGA